MCMYLTRISVAVPCFSHAAGPAAAALLIAGAARHRVPNDAISRCVFFKSDISVFFFDNFKPFFFSCTPWQYCRMYSLASSMKYRR